jgi:hypothetical protein
MTRAGPVNFAIPKPERALLQSGAAKNLLHLGLRRLDRPALAGKSFLVPLFINQRFH